MTGTDSLAGRLRRMEDDEHRAFVAEKRGARMHEVDKLPPEIRALVHEYGYSVVRTLMDCGVTKPNRIRHCVETVLNEFSPTRGSFSIQGLRNNIMPSRRNPASPDEEQP